MDSIKNINNYLKNVYSTFGGKSREYMAALNEVREILPDNVINETAKSGNNYKADNPRSALQFKDTAKANEIFSHFETELKQIESYSENKGNIQKQIQPYKDQLNYWGHKDTPRNIKKWAKWEYDFNEMSNDWYKDLTESENLTNDEREQVRDLYSRVSGNYEDPDFKLEFHNKITKFMCKANAAAEDAPEVSGGEVINPLELVDPLS